MKANYTSSPDGGDIQIVAFHLDKFLIHITVLLFVLMVIILKMLYHRILLLKQFVPESLLLICIGVAFGAIIRFGMASNSWKLTPALFFQILLPPIVLDSAYFLYNRTFAEHLGTILIYAVVGTIVNFLIIGPMMYAMEAAGAFNLPDLNFGLKGYLLFASLIVAVDPVAVLAIFQDIGVELGLYYMVFGESLLNDAVTVVIYQIMSVLMGKNEITFMDILLGLISFFTVSLGGLIVGILFGVLTCLITRFSSSMESLVILIIGYFSYIVGDMLGWSGIISMIGCGLTQAAYAFHNLDPSSVMVVRRTSKMVSELSEAVIFLFIGVELWGIGHFWHTGFCFFGLGLCLVSRLLAVLLLTALINLAHADGFQISVTEQLILAYGGLRGAVAFSLSELIDDSSLKGEKSGVELKGILISATLFIILFTVGVMGLTMKPLVRLLKIRTQAAKELSLFAELNSSVINHAMMASEIMTGERGRNLTREVFIRFNNRYIRRLLQREPETHDQKIIRVFEKIALKLHFATIHPEHRVEHLEQLPDTLKTLHFKTTSPLPAVRSRQASEAKSAETVSGVRRKVSRKSSVASIVFNGLLSKPFEELDHPTQIVEALRTARRTNILDLNRPQADFHTALISMLQMKQVAINRAPSFLEPEQAWHDISRYRADTDISLVDSVSQTIGQKTIKKSFDDTEPSSYGFNQINLSRGRVNTAFSPDDPIAKKWMNYGLQKTTTVTNIGVIGHNLSPIIPRRTRQIKKTSNCSIQDRKYVKPLHQMGKIGPTFKDTRSGSVEFSELSVARECLTANKIVEEISPLDLMNSNDIFNYSQSDVVEKKTSFDPREYAVNRAEGETRDDVYVYKF